MTAYDHWLTGGHDCRHDPRSPAYDSSADEAIAERAEELLDAYRADPDKVAEADDWLDGSFDSEHYSNLERALADLGSLDPADLSGTGALANVLRLAQIHAAARDAKLKEMAGAEAQAEADREAAESEAARSFARADSRWAA